LRRDAASSACRETRQLPQTPEQELGVGLGRPEIVEECDQGIADGEAGELFADVDDFLELVRVVEAVVVAGA
jgi:hypothetical protein